MVDESFRMPAGPFRTTYDRTKWLAHYQVAVPLIEAGAPITIACPGAIFGPRDTSLVGDLMRRFVAGQFPIFPAPDLTLTYTYVEDLADGLILAAEKGVPGETYNFTGPALPLGEMVKIWAELTGKRAPYLYAPAAIIKPLGPLMGLIGSIIPLSPFFNPESISILDVAYTASNAKVRRELGWIPRPIRLGMRETMAWFASQDQPLIRRARKRKTITILALASAGVLFVYWLAYRRKRKTR
jgi:nucleoside-diphosphate-sugar epimerase